MPYRSNDELPERVRGRLPSHAQDIYRESFNHAWETYKDNLRQEEIAHRVAWAAVKKSYHKVGDVWRPKSQMATLQD